MDSKITVGTRNFTIVSNTCKDARNQSKMIAIIGYPGAGKTTALLHFYKKNENTFYVKVLPSMSPRVFYSTILQNMGIPDQQNGVTLHSLIQKIAFNLNNSNGKNLLIIDEAGKFTKRMLEYIHELRDLTEESTGIILAGPDYFKSNLHKWNNKNLDGMPEIFRRIQNWQHLKKPNKSEVIAICEAYGLTEKTTSDRLFGLCKNFGELHNQIMEFKYLEEKIISK